MTRSDSNIWKRATKEEIKVLEENKTWEMTDEPENKKVIDVKWIFRTKIDDKYKARFVARGFQQLHTEDWNYSKDIERLNYKYIMDVIKRIKNSGNCYFSQKNQIAADKKYKTALRYYEWMITTVIS